jgi:hypothetical protein
MNTKMINHTQPKSLSAGAMFFPVAAAKNNSPGLKQDSDSRPLYSVETIQIRASAMSPLLQEMLDHRPPDHWGLNE